jgi:hypothetical protein
MEVVRNFCRVSKQKKFFLGFHAKRAISILTSLEIRRKKGLTIDHEVNAATTIFFIECHG